MVIYLYVGCTRLYRAPAYQQGPHSPDLSGNSDLSDPFKKQISGFIIINQA
jgi:hypothetical protein